MAYQDTQQLFTVVEATNAAKVPFAAGQYIIQSDGIVYYDPTTATSVAGRVKLTPDVGGKVSVFTVAEGAADTTSLATVTNPIQGDMAICKHLIAGTTDKYSYTAYVYSGTQWEAMDGNYNAENVYFDKNLVTTSAVGNITLTNGQATIAAQGKNLKQVFDTIFVKEQDPTVTPPNVSFSSYSYSNGKPAESGTYVYEVGTSISPTYTASFSGGKYAYNANNGATGITVKTWEISDSNSKTASTATGTMPAFTVTDSTDYRITAKATWETGTIVPVTNVGNQRPSLIIQGGSKSVATAKNIKGFRATFYGTFADKTTALTSANIRKLTGKSTKALAAGNSFTLTIPVGATRVVFAYPATLRDATQVKDAATQYNVLSSFTKTTVDVEGANSYAAKSYKVYYSDFAEPNGKANTYTVTI